MKDYGLQETKGRFQKGGRGEGIKKGMDCMEHWVFYANSESWNTTSKTNDVLYGD